MSEVSKSRKSRKKGRKKVLASILENELESNKAMARAVRLNQDLDLK